MFCAYYKSPIGNIRIVANDKSILRVDFNDTIKIESSFNSVIEKCIEQIDEYFIGKRKVFELHLEPEGTIFQKRVWNELMKIPFGETITYLKLAKILGNEKTIRAVAQANARNKISIIIPCHRVIGTDGKLTGYGGGLWRKKWLLEHEESIRNNLKQQYLFSE